jgi:hypothetical protein
MGRRVMLIGHRENVFNYLPAVEFFPNWEMALAALTPRRRLAAA